jgi:hypothetical protein
VADFDGDVVLDRMVEFKRAAVRAVVQAQEATVTSNGRSVSGTSFEGTAAIRVLDREVKDKGRRFEGCAGRGTAALEGYPRGGAQPSPAARFLTGGDAFVTWRQSDSYV